LLGTSKTLGIISGILVLALAACGGGSDSGSSETPQATPAGTASEEVGREEFGMTDEQLVTAIEDVESLIASCMADAGFEYIPIDPITFQDAMSSLGSVAGLSDEEFVTQYGYGYTTLPPVQQFGAGEENTAIFNDLSPADQVAYERTLWGDNSNLTFVYMLENEDLEGAGGCTLEAIQQVLSEEQLNPNFLNPFDALVYQDPRYIDAVAKWSDCMRDAGYDYESPEDAEDQLIERFNSLVGGADPATLTGSDKDALAELQGEERAIAQADLQCQEQELREVEQQVERDISGRN